MKVRTLIKLLQNFPQNANVLILTNRETGEAIPVTMIDTMEPCNEKPLIPIVKGFYNPRIIKKKKKKSSNIIIIWRRVKNGILF